MDKPDRNETTEESLFPKRDQHVPAPAKSRPPASSALWRESPTSLTRDRAPSHRIPKAERFCSTKLDLLKCQQLESMQLEREEFRATGVSFARSTRPDHFLRQTATPSPAAYHIAGMECSSRRARTEQSLGRAPSASDIRGATMNQFFNYHKAYMPQAKHRPYQPECTLGNPSPAHYSPNCTLRSKDVQHSFKHALTRFREAPANSPGPAAYRPASEERPSSFNAKGTFPKSNRTYLRLLEPRRIPSAGQLPS